jgi:Skp family chaperone for outer membrane proteins
MKQEGKNMKKMICSLVIVSFAMFVLGGTFAHAATNIGFIEVQKVFKGYKETAKAQEQVSKQEEEFKKDFESSQKQLADAEKNKMKKADLDKLKKDLEDKLMPKRQALVALNEKLTSDLQAKILGATKDVAKEIGIDVVFDKQVVITGGTDMTELVINKLNEKK